MNDNIGELKFVKKNDYTIAELNGEEIGRAKKVPMSSFEKEKEKDNEGE